MPDPTAQPSASPAPSPSAWLLGPAELAAIRADAGLRDRLARGEQPSEDDPDPAARLLGAWLREVEDGGARLPPSTSTTPRVALAATGARAAAWRATTSRCALLRSA